MVKSKKISTLSPQEHAALDSALKTWGLLTRIERGDVETSLANSSLSSLSKHGIKLNTNYHCHNKIAWISTIERLDELINQLYRVNPKWANVIKWRYSERGNLRYQAKHHKIAKSTYHDRLKKGREWLGQALLH